MKSFTILLKSKLFEYLKGETTISWNLNNWNSWSKDGSRFEAPFRFNCPKCQQISGPFLPSHNWTIFFMFSLWLVYWLLLSPIVPGFGLLQKVQKLCWILQKRIYEYGRFVSCTHNGFWMMYFSTFRVGILHICNRYEWREVTWVCLGKHNVSLDDGHLIIFQITIGSQKKNLKFDTFGKTYWKVFVQKSH